MTTCSTRWTKSSAKTLCEVPPSTSIPILFCCPHSQEYRRKHGDKWQREKSEQLALPTRKEVEKWQTILQNASNADQQVISKYDSIRRRWGWDRVWLHSHCDFLLPTQRRCCSCARAMPSCRRHCRLARVPEVRFGARPWQQSELDFFPSFAPPSAGNKSAEDELKAVLTELDSLRMERDGLEAEFDKVKVGAWAWCGALTVSHIFGPPPLSHLQVKDDIQPLLLEKAGSAAEESLFEQQLQLYKPLKDRAAAALSKTDAAMARCRVCWLLVWA